jgi:hypothetical protein
MSTRKIKIIMFLWSKVRRVRGADNLTAGRLEYSNYYPALKIDAASCSETAADNTATSHEGNLNIAKLWDSAQYSLLGLYKHIPVTDPLLAKLKSRDAVGCELNIHSNQRPARRAS